MKILREAFGYIDHTLMLTSGGFNNVIKPLYEQNGYTNLVQNNDRKNDVIIENELKEDDWDDCFAIEIKEDSYILYINTFFKIVSDTLIISHAPIFTSKGQSIEEVINVVMQRFQDVDYKKVYHLCPEVITSSIDWTGLGREHICLRFLEYDGEVLKSNVLIDPRSIAQQFYDGVNCGRYVLMMLSVALRYIENGCFVQDFFDKNPLIMSAPIFKNIPELQQAVNCLYQYPALVDLRDTTNIEEQLKFIYQFRCDQGMDYHAWSSFVPSFMFSGFSARDKLDALNRQHAISSQVLSQGSCGSFLDASFKENKTDSLVVAEKQFN